MTYSKGEQTPYSDQKNWSNDYLTDPKLVKLLGPFDFDPACPIKMPWRTAKRMCPCDYVGNASGLDVPWRGRVFMNPPYRGVLAWARKFAEHGNGIALLNGRATETQATQAIMAASKAIWFPGGRLTFYQPNGEPYSGKWFPSLLIGMRSRDEEKFCKAAAVYGGTIYSR